MARQTPQTSVQLQPYHKAGVKVIEQRMKAQGKGNSKGLMSQLVREGLELLFAAKGVTLEEIQKHLPK